MSKVQSITSKRRRTKSSVTMSDVARHAGVSTATVSRALKNDPAVTADTRLRVKREALELGYVMHRQARALRQQRSATVGVHVPIDNQRVTGALSNPFVLEFLAEVGTALHAAGLDMLVSHSRTVDPELHRSRLVDGYIQLGHGEDDTDLVRLAAAGVPIAVWTPPAADRDYVSVGVDNVDLARQAVRHLIDNGRERIGVVADGLTDARSEAAQRFEGYRQGLTEAGIEFRDDLVASADRRNESGARAIGQLLDAVSDLDAVFVAYSDVVALSVIRELRDRDVAVPDDIAVVGFDNISMAEYSHPRLTTVDQGLATGIPILVDKLLRQIEGETVGSQYVDGALVVRESCGARPQGTRTAATPSATPSARPSAGHDSEGGSR